MPLRLFWRIVLSLAVLLAVPYFLLVVATSSAEFRSFAESRVSDTLKADVRIGKIRVGFLNRIILSDFKIHSDQEQASPYRLEVERIVFRYTFQQLLKREFKIPAAIFLKSPQVLTQTGSSLASFEKIQMRFTGSEISFLGLVGTGIQLSLIADFPNSKLSGSWKTPFGQKSFKGTLSRENGRYSFSDLSSSPSLEAFVDIQTGEAGLYLENQPQQLDVNISIQPQGFELVYDAQHWNFWEMDLVSAGRLSLRPLENHSDESFRFEAHFKTDMFIWEYVPFEDFKGEFEVTASGLRHLRTSWGKVFKGSGEILSSPEEGWQSQLTVRVNGFDLEQVKHFAAKPLPRDLGGKLKGQLKIQGALAHPYVAGRLTIQDGHIDQLEFDSGVIQLEGVVPYLKLEDSRIYKGRTSLSMTGALDLSLKNMFHGVQIRKFDQGILWNGMQMSVEAEKENRDLEMNTGLAYFPALGIKAGKGSAPDQDPAGSENYFELGPRLKF